MELWFSEPHTKHAKFSVQIKESILTRQSRYQRIDVMDTYDFGRILTLDGYMMLTEKDEFIYHEMMVHLPMAVNPDIRRVLVIGAGDGGTIRELTRYPTIEHIDMVEIDREVVEVCKEYLPQTACKLEDPRVHIYYEDGLKFVRYHEQEYDLILVDSTDPFGPGDWLLIRRWIAPRHRPLCPPADGQAPPGWQGGVPGDGCGLFKGRLSGRGARATGPGWIAGTPRARPKPCAGIPGRAGSALPPAGPSGGR